MIPLNQSYRISATLADRHDVAACKMGYERWAVARGLGPRGGRSYDFALAFTAVDFTGMRVLELGARDSYFGAFLTDRADVIVSDGFIGFHGSGGFDHWRARWTEAANDPRRLNCTTIDMRAMPYEDATFDAVLNISCVEHLHGDDDMVAVREMARIVKPGGFLVIGTDTAESDRRCAGRYYDERTLHERLIEPTGCDMYGPSDLSWAGCDKTMHKSGAFLRSACLFVLRKP